MILRVVFVHNKCVRKLSGMVDAHNAELFSHIYNYTGCSLLVTRYTKRKCGASRLSVRRFWKTLKQINNTPHRYGHCAESTACQTGDECNCFSLLQ